MCRRRLKGEETLNSPVTAEYIVHQQSIFVYIRKDISASPSQYNTVQSYTGIVPSSIRVRNLTVSTIHRHVTTDTRSSSQCVRDHRPPELAARGRQGRRARLSSSRARVSSCPRSCTACSRCRPASSSCQTRSSSAGATRSRLRSECISQSRDM